MAPDQAELAHQAEVIGEVAYEEARDPSSTMTGPRADR